MENYSYSKSTKHILNIDSIENPKSSAGLPKKLKKISKQKVKLSSPKNSLTITNSSFLMIPPVKKLKVTNGKNNTSEFQDNACQMMTGPASAENIFELHLPYKNTNYLEPSYSYTQNSFNSMNNNVNHSYSNNIDNDNISEFNSNLSILGNSILSLIVYIDNNATEEHSSSGYIISSSCVESDTCNTPDNNHANNASNNDGNFIEEECNSSSSSLDSLV